MIKIKKYNQNQKKQKFQNMMNTQMKCLLYYIIFFFLKKNLWVQKMKKNENNEQVKINLFHLINDIDEYNPPEQEEVVLDKKENQFKKKQNQIKIKL